jgi:hypothetical protein
MATSVGENQKGSGLRLGGGPGVMQAVAAINSSCLKSLPLYFFDRFLGAEARPISIVQKQRPSLLQA